MKKLIMTVAIGFTAILHGATIAWGGFIANAEDSDVEVTTGSMAYLVYSTTDMTSLIGETFYADTAWGEGTKIVQTHEISAEEAKEEWQFVENYDEATTGYYAVVLVDADKSNSSYGAFTDSKEFTFVNPTDSADLKLATGWEPGEYLASSGSGEFKNAPEPTSGLLILLGMAGLALKRKQK